MAGVFLSPFKDPSLHEAVSNIIRRRSTNPRDVRESVLRGLDISSARRVLDLGCGFGFLTEAVARRVAPEARFVGVDACPTNKEPYLARLSAGHRSGCFVCQRIQESLDWPPNTFDLVLASYALYFFPGVLPEIARVLAPGGMLLAITHTEKAAGDLARTIESPHEGAQLLGLIRNFCAENAHHLLRPWFATVERVDYENTLVFPAGHWEELLTYITFKLRILMPEETLTRELPEIVQRVARTVVREGQVILDKSDAAFYCRQPQCR